MQCLPHCTHNTAALSLVKYWNPIFNTENSDVQVGGSDWTLANDKLYNWTKLHTAGSTTSGESLQQLLHCVWLACLVSSWSNCRLRLWQKFLHAVWLARKYSPTDAFANVHIVLDMQSMAKDCAFVWDARMQQCESGVIFWNWVCDPTFDVTISVNIENGISWSCAWNSSAVPKYFSHGCLALELVQMKQTTQKSIKSENMTPVRCVVISQGQAALF